MINNKKLLFACFLCFTMIVAILIPHSTSFANENSDYTPSNTLDNNISYEEGTDNTQINDVDNNINYEEGTDSTQTNDFLDKNNNVEMNILSTTTKQHNYYSSRLNSTWYSAGTGLGNANYTMNIHVIYTITTYGDEFGEITHSTDMTRHQSVAIAQIPNYPYVVEIANTARYYNNRGGRQLGMISDPEWDLRNTWVDYFYDPNHKLFGGAVTKTITNNGYGAHLENKSGAYVKTGDGNFFGSENTETTEIGF